MKEHLNDNLWSAFECALNSNIMSINMISRSMNSRQSCLVVKLSLNTPLEILVYRTQVSSQLMDSPHHILVGLIQTCVLYLQGLAVINVLSFLALHCQITLIRYILMIQRRNIVLHFLVQLLQQNILLRKLLRQQLLMLYRNQVVFNTAFGLGWVTLPFLEGKVEGLDVFAFGYAYCLAEPVWVNCNVIVASDAPAYLHRLGSAFPVVEPEEFWLLPARVTTGRYHDCFLSHLWHYFVESQLRCYEFDILSLPTFLDQIQHIQKHFPWVFSALRSTEEPISNQYNSISMANALGRCPLGLQLKTADVVNFIRKGFVFGLSFVWKKPAVIGDIVVGQGHSSKEKQLSSGCL